MTKRFIPLLVLTLIVGIAPTALADHCERCRPVPQTCGPALTPSTGWEICYEDAFGCHVEFPCGPHAPAVLPPLAAEFSVATVERLDEPKTAANEALIAAVAAPAPANR